MSCPANRPLSTGYDMRRGDLLIRPCVVCRGTSILHLVGASPAGDQTLVDHRLFAWLASSHKILPSGNTRLRLHRAESITLPHFNHDKGANDFLTGPKGPGLNCSPPPIYAKVSNCMPCMDARRAANGASQNNDCAGTCWTRFHECRQHLICTSGAAYGHWLWGIAARFRL